VKNTSPSGTFMQKIYVTTKNGYALELFYTYIKDADLAALNSIVASMKIK
jgi:predicted ABC-type ATPase